MIPPLTNVDFMVNTLTDRLVGPHLSVIELSTLLFSVLKVQEEAGELADVTRRYFKYRTSERKPESDSDDVREEILDVAAAALVTFALFQRQNDPYSVVDVESELLGRMWYLISTRSS